MQLVTIYARALFQQPSVIHLSVVQSSFNFYQLRRTCSYVTDAQVGITLVRILRLRQPRTVVAEGQKVFLGILKRLYRSMKREFRKRYL